MRCIAFALQLQPGNGDHNGDRSGDRNGDRKRQARERLLATDLLTHVCHGSA